MKASISHKNPKSLRAWVRKNPLRMILVICGFVILIILLVGLISFVKSAGKVSLEDAAKCQSKKTDVTAESLRSDPQALKGKCVQVSGKVFKVESGDGLTTFQIFSQPETSQGNIIVAIPGSSKIQQGEYIEAAGVIQGAIKGQNAFGATLSVPSVIAPSIQLVDRSAVIAPAVVSKNLNQSQEQSGVTIAISKIEYGASETRVYLNVKNDSGSKASIFGFNSKLIQDGSQVKQKNVFDDKKNEIPNDILTGTEESGIIYFEAANPSQSATVSFEVYIEGKYPNSVFSFEVPAGLSS